MSDSPCEEFTSRCCALYQLHTTQSLLQRPNIYLIDICLSAIVGNRCLVCGVSLEKAMGCKHPKLCQAAVEV